MMEGIADCEAESVEIDEHAMEERAFTQQKKQRFKYLNATVQSFGCLDHMITLARGSILMAVSDKIRLRRWGNSYFGICPFCSGRYVKYTSRPSVWGFGQPFRKKPDAKYKFVVRYHEGTYRCLRCRASGNAERFVEGWRFKLP